jgi:hypothetical protein
MSLESSIVPTSRGKTVGPAPVRMGRFCRPLIFETTELIGASRNRSPVRTFPAGTIAFPVLRAWMTLIRRHAMVWRPTVLCGNWNGATVKLRPVPIELLNSDRERTAEPWLIQLQQKRWRGQERPARAAMDWLSFRSPGLYCWSFCFTTLVCLIRLLHFALLAIAATFWYAGRKPGIEAVLLSSLIPGFIVEGATAAFLVFCITWCFCSLPSS